MGDEKEATEFDAFQRQAWERAGEHARSPEHLPYLLLGLCEEAGEVGGVVKKCHRKGQPLDREKYLEELGDVLWYVAMAAGSLGASLGEVVRAQLAKNRKRYPEGFTREASAVRADELPRRAIVCAVEVAGSSPPGWLVTLECGHKRAVREKLVEYPCRDCAADEVSRG